MTTLTITIRAIHLAASLLLVGMWTFLLLVLRPASRTQQPENQDERQRIDRVLLRAGSWSLLAMLVSGLFGLWTQLATATGRSLLQALTVDDLWNILTSTQYGRVWTIRMALLALLGGFLWFGRDEQDTRERWAWRLTGTILAVSLLVTQAWISHTATDEGWPLMWQTLANGLHLLASGMWLGGLPFLAYLLSWALHRGDTRAEAMAAEATWRFSVLALLSVSVLTITGLANAWKLVGAVPALIGTVYGRLLLLKIGLFLLLLGLAALNLRREKPRLVQAVRHQQHLHARQSLRRLRRNVSGELCIGGLILLIVGALGILPPAYHEQPTWPLAFRLNWTATQETLGVRSSMTIGIRISLCGGLVVLLAAITRMRYWLGTVLAGLVMVGIGCMVWLPQLAVEAYPTTYLRPPVSYNAHSIATGSRLYTEHCANCHGIEGYGNGLAASGMHPPPTDLTAKQVANRTAGDIFWWLTYGKPGTAMPGFAARFSEEERWDLINFVRTISAAEQARRLSPRLAPAWLVAPDFTYTAQMKDVSTLTDHRGREHVLLVFFTVPYSFFRLAQLRDLYPQVRALSSEILGIPLQNTDASKKMLIPFHDYALGFPFPIVTDGAPEAVAAYTLFRRSLDSASSPPNALIPPHVEFLIDRTGYLRARWILQEGKGWGSTSQLLRTIEQLQQEKLGVPVPSLHVH